MENETINEEIVRELEIGKEYYFKTTNRKKSIRGVLISKNSNYTGLSLYNGTKAIEFKTRRGTKYTLSLYGIDKIRAV